MDNTNGVGKVRGLLYTLALCGLHCYCLNRYCGNKQLITSFTAIYVPNTNKHCAIIINILINIVLSS